jgi:topoisomerase-4 subunit B
MKNKSGRISAGNLVLEEDIIDTTNEKVLKLFLLLTKLFKNYKFRMEYVVKMIQNYCYLNNFNHHFNGEKYYSENGLKDLLATINVEDLEYPIIHLRR